MQLYVSLKINSNIPFPNLIKASNIFQPIFPVALPYINDSVVVSQNSKKNKNDAPSLCDKVFRSKNRSWTCANRECVGPAGLSSHPQVYGLHHPWIALGASPLIHVKKLQNTDSPISFLWGDISSDRQTNCLLHKILKQKLDRKSVV